MMVSVRSTLTAGLAAGLVAAVAVVTLPVPARTLPTVSSPAVQLSAVMAALPQPAAALPALPDPFVGLVPAAAGDWIINGYNLIQPWVEYGVELVGWGFSWLPWPIGLIGPQADILYNGWQPIGESLAYSAAFLLDGQFDLIVPTLVNGVRTGIQNLVQGEIQWVLSFFPPLPPISLPVLPGAATLATRAAVVPRSAATVPTETPVPVPTEVTAAAESAPAPSAESAPPATRPASRSARVQRAVPAPALAAASSAAVTSEPAPVTAGSAEAPSARKSTSAGKAKAGAGGSTRAARAAR